MKTSALILPLFLLALAACSNDPKSPEKKDSTAENKPAAKTARLSCRDIGFEAPSGEQTLAYDEEGRHYSSSFDVKGDTLYHYTYSMDTVTKDTYVYMEVVAAALKDIDPAGLEASEYDLDLVDGSKLHQTVFFVKAKKEESLFRSSTYTCLEGSDFYSVNMVHTCNFGTSSMAMSKKAVETIRSKMPK